MPKGTFEKIIKSDLKKTFHITTDFEGFQKIIPQFYRSVRIISIRDNATIIEEHIRLADLELIMMVKHVISEPTSHEFFVIGGDSKGTHVICRYELVPQGTKMIFEINWKLNAKLKLLIFFKKINVLTEYSKIINSLLSIAEN